MRIEPIGHVESPYPTKFGVPRQPGLVRGLLSWLVFEDEGRLEPYAFYPGSYIWLVWDFSENHRIGKRWSPTVRPPRLGGNRRVGVFASRSSFRPNNLAISSLQVAGAPEDGRVPLIGGDLVDGTPVYAVRCYDPARDYIPDASAGWLSGNEWRPLSGVEVSRELLGLIPEELRQGVREILLQDPRPAYTRETQPDREFWVPVGRIVVSFRVADDVAIVTNVQVLGDSEFELLRREGTIS